MNFRDIVAQPRCLDVIDDMVASLFDKISEGILHLNVLLYGLVGDIFNFATDTDGHGSFDQYLPGTLISQHPAEFSGGAVWTLIETLSNNVIVPIAAFMLMIVLVTDLVQILISGNQFQEANPVTIMKWFMKAVIGLVIVSKVYYIASGIFALGASAGSGGLAEVGAAVNVGAILIDETHVSGWDIGFLILMLVFGLITLLLVFVLFLVISAVLAGRIIEVFMYMSVAPLTAATFMNSEWKSVGYGWVKGVIAIAFQGFFVVVALAVFSGIFINLFDGLDSGGEVYDFLFGIGILDAYLVALMFTVMRSGSISKAIFNAH